ncbi:MAG: DEAD/DEAH box helicase, partial [Myxococcota bacterium]
MADDHPLAFAHAPVKAWFEAAFAGGPTHAQSLAWPAIAAGGSTLLLAPTGSGKTLAAFLVALDRLMFAPRAEPKGIRILYVSPLKALGVDVERNLRAPLAGIRATADRLEHPVRVPEVAVRSGDTPQKERQRMLRHPPDILITTPESLYLMLTSGARSILETVDSIIVDEIHAMAATKRGAHLFLSLERLERLRAQRDLGPPQRVGLSATQRPLEEIARLLGGGRIESGRWKPRPVNVVDAGQKKALDLLIEVPVEDMARLGEVDGTV